MPCGQLRGAALRVKGRYEAGRIDLLADPVAVLKFDEHEVVLPVVVITELEGKRDHPELGYFARTALRKLDELRVIHGRLDTPIPARRAISPMFIADSSRIGFAPPGVDMQLDAGGRRRGPGGRPDDRIGSP